MIEILLFLHKLCFSMTGKSKNRLVASGHSYDKTFSNLYKNDKRLHIHLRDRSFSIKCLGNQ